jgi:hypothetical protein
MIIKDPLDDNINQSGLPTPESGGLHARAVHTKWEKKKKEEKKEEKKKKKKRRRRRKRQD